MQRLSLLFSLLSIMCVPSLCSAHFDGLRCNMRRFCCTYNMYVYVYICQYLGILAAPSARRDVLPVGPIPSPASSDQ